MPAPVNSILIGKANDPEKLIGLVFAGITGDGAVYRFHPGTIGATVTIAEGLGDTNNLGQCCVNRLALHDMDGDGKPELIGSTSQLIPRGQPRLFVWSSDLSLITTRAVARPEILSSWSHSLGFLHRPGQGPDSAFITYCGYGEIVEFRMRGHETTTDGFHCDELGWKQVGKVPASGEWLQVCDADNDGKPDVCVATGFALNKAAILLYRSEAPGTDLKLLRTIDEGKRFGNVRFQVTDLEGDGQQEVIAWWCTDLASGDAEMIAYHVGPEGIRSRTVVAKGPAGDLWPDDGQFDCGDVDGDGRPELWFVTHGGAVWRYYSAQVAQTGAANRLQRVAHLREALGPIAIGRDPDFHPHTPITPDRLLLSHGQEILRLAPLHPES